MANPPDKVDPTNLTLSQESELNAKAASLEGFEQRMAFESYYKMGETRALTKLTKQVGRALSTLEKWSSEYRWTARIRERERQAAEFLLMQKSAEEEAQVRKKHLTLIDASIANWSKKLVEGKIRLTSVEDLERLVRLRWDVNNIPDKRVNTAAAGMGSSIDLRLRNMDRTEMQQFLYSTLRSIERVMGKRDPNQAPPQEPNQSKGKEKISLDLSVSMEEPGIEAPTPKNDAGVIDVEAVKLDDLDIDPDEDFNID